MLAVAESYAGEFYLFSGVNLEVSSESTQPKRRYLTDGYCYSAQGVWRKLQDVPIPIAAAPGPAMEIKYRDRDLIVVMGGDRETNRKSRPRITKVFRRS